MASVSEYAITIFAAFFAFVVWIPFVIFDTVPAAIRILAGLISATSLIAAMYLIGVLLLNTF